MATGAEAYSWDVNSVSRASVLSPQGRLVATSHDDGSIILWDTVAGQKLRGFGGHSAPIRRLKFTPDGETLVSSDMPARSVCGAPRWIGRGE